LSKLANDQSPTGSARRTALFADTKFTPILWSQLLREALLFLGRDYQLFLGRGKLPTVSAPTTAPAAAPVQAAPPGTPTQLIKKPIYKPTQPSPVRAVLDSFAADGSFSQAVETSVDATHLPEIFKSVENILRPAPPAAAIVRTQTVGLTTRLKNMGNDFVRELIVRYVPASVLEVSNRWTSWWRRERVNKKVDACLPHREVDVLIIDSKFLCYPIYS
jgi:nucleoporin NDC1